MTSLLHVQVTILEGRQRRECVWRVVKTKDVIVPYPCNCNYSRFSQGGGTRREVFDEIHHQYSENECDVGRTRLHKIDSIICTLTKSCNLIYVTDKQIHQ